MHMKVTESEKDTEYQYLTPLFQRLADPRVSEATWKRVRDVLITEHLPLATHIAQKYAHRGQSVEDLEQVARIGLINAVDRFDPSRGSRFLSFAVPTIIGEVRRYFRDRTWSVKVPRRLQESYRTISTMTDDLAHELDCWPRPRQIAERLHVPVDEVNEGLRAGLAYRPDSLDYTDSDATRRGDVRALPAELDADLELIDDRETLYRAMADLPERDASVVIMRFFGNMTEVQIAQRIGISQMQVSRLLSKSLCHLRRAFLEPADANRSHPAGPRRCTAA